MMPAKGIKVAIKSEYAGDIAVIEKIFKNYKTKNYFDPATGMPEVISVSEFDMADEFDIALDMTEEGCIKLKTEVGETEILYAEDDRKALLTQLIVMFSGNRIIDADISEIMKVVGSQCRAVCKYWGFLSKEKYYLEGEEYLEPGERLNEILNEVVGENDPGDMDIFIQITGDNPIYMTQIELNCDFRNVVWQIIDTEEDYPEDGECIVTVFSRV